MSLPATNGNTIFGSDLFQLCQPSGNTAKEPYYITANGSSGASIGCWCASQSRGAVPVSVSLDTSFQSPSNCNSPSTDHLSQYGVHIFTTTTGTVLSANVGGLATFQY